MSVNDIEITEIIPPISLLEERLVIRRSKRKLGEVIIRKEVEVKIIEVPIRREKLIVEQIIPKYKKIATIDLGNDIDSLEEISEGISLEYDRYLVKGEFESIKVASQFLEAIACLSNSGCKGIEITIKVENASIQQTYQELLENF